MHVGLNLVYLVPGETGGMEVAARELLPRLMDQKGIRLTAFVNREAAATPGPWRELEGMCVVPVEARNRVGWVWGEQRHIPRLASRAGCDLVHSLGSTAPLYGPFTRVTTIHDLNYKFVPEAHFGLRNLGMRLLVPAAARRSHRIITVSHSTRTDLTSVLGVPPQRVDVIPHGVTQEPAAAATAEGEVRSKLNLGERRVVLSLSAKRPHKNLSRLLYALSRVPEDERPVLVAPGYPTPYGLELEALAESLGIEGDVRMPPWLPTEDLDGLYAIATCMVFPSLYEGFGLPVLEAMAHGVPVACSNRSSLPEVAGGAALLFDPEDVDAIQRAMNTLLRDADRARTLAEAGRKRAREFTWEKTADLTVETYRRALAARR